MSVKYRGVRSRILNVNKYAEHVPCLTHSLNLVGNNAPSISEQMVTFFGQVEAVYDFFTGSTERWEN